MSRMRTKNRQAPVVSMVLVLTNEGDTNGGWEWLTDVVDLPIAAALADLLLSGGPS